MNETGTTGQQGDETEALAREDRSVSLLRANFLMVYFALPAVLILGVPYFLLWGFDDVRAVFVDGELLPLLLAILLGIVVHEAVHGLTWKWSTGKPFGVIRFGFDWKTVTPYAHCTEPMKARPYRIGAIMPLLLLGMLPALYAIAFGSAAWAGFGLFFTFAAGGDMLILWLLRDIAPDAMVEDHPSRAGCYVLPPEETSGNA